MFLLCDGCLSQVHAVVAEDDDPMWWEKSPGPNMIDIHSTDQFIHSLSEAGNELVIVKFDGTWCAFCQASYTMVVCIIS